MGHNNWGETFPFTSSGIQVQLWKSRCYPFNPPASFEGDRRFTEKYRASGFSLCTRADKKFRDSIAAQREAISVSSFKYRGLIAFGFEAIRLYAKPRFPPPYFAGRLNAARE